jgi:hypothetical protein
VELFAASKRLSKRILSSIAYRKGQPGWRAMVAAAERLGATMARIGLAVGGRRAPDMLIFFGVAPGDDLLCTAVLRELRRRGRENVWIASNYPEIFSGNGDVAEVVPFDSPYRRYATIWRCDVRHLEYSRFSGDQGESPRRHIIAELCARAGITGRITLKPTFALTEQEQACGTFAENKVVIQSGGLAAIFPMRNKMWFPERFQGVVDHLRRDIEFVQLGSAADPELSNVLDLRGKTSIRQSASILHHARAYIGTVGFLMHLARAVECPSVIVYGGREAPWQSGYTGNINLYNGLPCSPCWRWNSCDFERKCMTDITIAEVVRAMRSLLSTSRGPLPVDTDELP